jgi:hypothetical protein
MCILAQESRDKKRDKVILKNKRERERERELRVRIRQK